MPLLFAMLSQAPAAKPAPAPPSAAATDEAPLPRRSGPMGLRLQDAQGGKLDIAAVMPGSPAAKAGVEAGMRVISVNGTAISSRDDMQKAMRTAMAGSTVSLQAQRGDAPPRNFAVKLEAMSESVPGQSVRYGDVRVPDGYRIRTIITEPEPGTSPLARNGRMPAVLYVQGIPCQTVDRPTMTDAADTRILHALAAAGYVTMRVDKPGIGDSEGPPCEDIDLKTELEGFKAALKQLAAMPQVDSGRLYIFGHSMGGVMAPYLSTAVPVRGIIVYGTLVRTWFEYQLENVRRQAALQPGASEAEITDAVLAEAKSSAMVLVDKKTLGDVW
ncbi:MAG: alpha/beta fold hydrolase, partial [Planctomycetota bacterium]